MNDPSVLEGFQRGDPRAADDLLPLVYDELRRLAARRLAGENGERTLNPTALVHEAWLRIGGADGRAWNGREHFFAAAAQAMRRILVDRARRRQAAKRNGNVVPAELVESQIAAPAPDAWLLAVHEALEKLHAVHPQKAELVQLRYFVGLSFEEAAEILGIAVPTAKQWWVYARSWLRVEIAGSKDRFSPNGFEYFQSRPRRL
jgi:RNA polymerase sigma factor (TIGR02999 family)